METQLPLPQRGKAPPIFGPYLLQPNGCCSQMAAGIKMPLGTEVGLGPGDFVLDGDPAPPPQKGDGAPNFRLVYCRQTAGWIKIVVRMDVGLSPGDFMLDGDPAPSPERGQSPPIFGPCLLW